jgi:hypothetical protein
MPKKKSFTLEDHYKTSILINKMTIRLIDLQMKILHVYGASSAAGREIETLVHSPDVFSDLKHSLGKAFAEEHGSDHKNPYLNVRGHA